MNVRIARICTETARVHLIAGCVHSGGDTTELDAAIAANLRELGYGG